MTDNKSQIEKFREAAKALGADVSDAEYDEAVAKVAKAPRLTDDEIKELARQLRDSELAASDEKSGRRRK